MIDETSHMKHHERLLWALEEARRIREEFASGKLSEEQAAAELAKLKQRDESILHALAS